MEMLKFNTCDDSLSNKQLHIFVLTMSKFVYLLILKSFVIYQNAFTHTEIMDR